MKTTDTLETLKSGTTQIAESTGHVVGGIADTAKKQAANVIGEVADRLAEHRTTAPEPPKRHRGRKVLGIAAGAAALGWLVKLARGTKVGRQVEERIIDLTGGGRTDEATFERLGSEGLDPVARGGMPT